MSGIEKSMKYEKDFDFLNLWAKKCQKLRYRKVYEIRKKCLKNSHFQHDIVKFFGYKNHNKMIYSSHSNSVDMFRHKKF